MEAELIIVDLPRKHTNSSIVSILCCYFLAQITPSHYTDNNIAILNKLLWDLIALIFKLYSFILIFFTY